MDQLPCLQCGRAPAVAILGGACAYFCCAECGARYAVEAIHSAMPPLYLRCVQCGERWSKCGYAQCEECEPVPVRPKSRRPECSGFDERQRRWKGAGT